jgi:hypothetical protein
MECFDTFLKLRKSSKFPKGVISDFREIMTTTSSNTNKETEVNTPVPIIMMLAVAAVADALDKYNAKGY